MTTVQNVQSLISLGYKGCKRRTYLLSFIDDQKQLAQLLNGPPDAEAIHRELSKRFDAWQASAQLPLSSFYALMKKWEAADLDPFASWDIGFTFHGFEKLGSPTYLLDCFKKKAPAFAQGAHTRAQERLRDTGPSNPSLWTEPYRHEKTDVVFIFHGDDAGLLKVHEMLVEALAKPLKVDIPTALRPFTPSAPYVEDGAAPYANQPRQIHFDMQDGLSNPYFMHPLPKHAADKPSSGTLPGLNDPLTIGRGKQEDHAKSNVHALGELLLGYPCNDQSNPWINSLTGTPLRSSSDPSQRPWRAKLDAFFKDGSFGVLRHTPQDVPAFNQFVERAASALGSQFARKALDAYVGNKNKCFKEYSALLAKLVSPTEQVSFNRQLAKQFVKAKMLGRWDSGAVVKPNELLDPGLLQAKTCNPQPPACAYRCGKPAAEALNQFSFTDDKAGLGCPFGSHIRRMNPREDPVVPFLRRPLLRRGMAYGKPFAPNDSAASADRGLLGLFFCSSIEDQFEHVVGNWAQDSPMGIPGQGPNQDPLIGSQDGLHNALKIPMLDDQFNRKDLHLQGLKPFVKTTGTLYAFFPSRSTLKIINKGMHEFFYPTSAS